LGRPNGHTGVGVKAGEAMNSWNHAAEKRLGRLNKSAANGGGMFAKPDCGGVLAAESFSTRVDMSKMN
jgi:hypothetical protein